MFNWQQATTGADNGLMPTRWQAIIWINDGLYSIDNKPSLVRLSPVQQTAIIWNNDCLLIHIWVTQPNLLKYIYIYASLGLLELNPWRHMVLIWKWGPWFPKHSPEILGWTHNDPEFPTKILDSWNLNLPTSFRINDFGQRWLIQATLFTKILKHHRFGIWTMEMNKFCVSFVSI